MVKSRKRKEKKCVHIFCFSQQYQPYGLYISSSALTLVLDSSRSPQLQCKLLGEQILTMSLVCFLKTIENLSVFSFVQPWLLINEKNSVCSRVTTTIQREHMGSNYAGYEVLGRKHLQNGNLNFSLLSNKFLSIFSLQIIIIICWVLCMGVRSFCSKK